MYRLCVLLTFATLSLASAQAEEPGNGTDNRDAEARGLFEAGRAAYSDGRFDEALDYFVRAHALSGRAQMYYNIGTAAERAGNTAQAIRAFERYLAELPDANNRGEVEARADALRRNPEPEEPESGSQSSVGGWVFVVSGSALAVAGVALLVVGNSAISRVSDAPEGSVWSDYEGDHDKGPLLANLGIGLAAAGLAAATVGIVLLATSGGDTQVAATPTGLRVRGRF